MQADYGYQTHVDGETTRLVIKPVLGMLDIVGSVIRFATYVGFGLLVCYLARWSVLASLAVAACLLASVWLDVGRYRRTTLTLDALSMRMGRHLYNRGDVINVGVIRPTDNTVHIVCRASPPRTRLEMLRVERDCAVCFDYGAHRIIAASGLSEPQANAVAIQLRDWAPKDGAA